MQNEIISYFEMCQREKFSLQRGMNFRPSGKQYSIILMSQHPNAPYEDEVRDDGRTLIYQGHDVPRRAGSPDPKLCDQPEFLPSGKPTDNGKFKSAADDFKSKIRRPERVRVYEKLRDGIWSYNGVFHLVDSWTESDGHRQVFKFKLTLLDEDDSPHPVPACDLPHQRLIPSHVKLEVWRRDAGKCVICSEKDNLHFDHVIPYSKGGSSMTAANVQLLCSRHNLQKHDRIE